MPGGAERARRARRLTALLAVLVVAIAVLALVSPLDRHHPQGRGTAAPTSASSTSTAATSSPAPSATASQAGRSAADVGVSECGRTRPSARPEQLTVVCGHGQPAVVVTEVSWNYWGQLNAFGTALVVTNSCDPTCADGQDGSYSVSVVLDDVRTTTGGTQFSRATVIWTPSRPARFRRPLQVALPVFSR